MKIRKSQTINKRVFWSFVLQTATSILLVGVLSGAITINLLKAQAIDNINSTFNDMSNKINNYSENIFKLSQSIMYDSDFINVMSFGEIISNYPAKTVNNILSSNSDILAIRITIDGIDYTVSREQNSLLSSDSVGYSEIYDLLNKSKKNTIWFVSYGDSKNSNIFFIRKIKDPYTGMERGTMTFQINSRVLYDISVSTVKNDEGKFCILSDKNIHLLNEFNIPEGTMQKIVQTETGTDSNFSKYYIYTVLPELNWKLVYVVDKFSTYKIVYLLFTLILLLCSLAIIMAALFARHIHETVVTPITELNKRMQTWSENDEFRKTQNYDTDEIDRLYIGFETMTSKVNNLININYKQTIMQRESELKMLQSQINPHFIFNTLESINSFAVIYDIKEISDITLALASLIEEGIGYQAGNKHTFGDEISLVENYLTIMHVRYGDRITLEKNVSDELLDIQMPSLILQPIAENAVIHGIIPSNRNGILKITANKDRDDLCINICDNGVGIPADKLLTLNNSFVSNEMSVGKSIGLMNVNKRLKLLYGESYHIKISSNISKGTNVFIRIAKEDKNEIQNTDCR